MRFPANISNSTRSYYYSLLSSSSSSFRTRHVRGGRGLTARWYCSRSTPLAATIFVWRNNYPTPICCQLNSIRWRTAGHVLRNDKIISPIRYCLRPCKRIIYCKVVGWLNAFRGYYWGCGYATGAKTKRHANRTHLNSFDSLARTPSRENRWGEKKQNMRHDIVGYADKRRGKLCSCHVSIKITIWNGHTSCDKCTCVAYGL